MGSILGLGSQLLLQSLEQGQSHCCMNEWTRHPAWRVGKEALQESRFSLPLQRVPALVSSLLQGSILFSQQGFLPRHYTGFFVHSESSLPRCRDREKGSWRDRQTENLIGLIWPVGLLPLESKAPPLFQGDGIKYNKPEGELEMMSQDSTVTG